MARLQGIRERVSWEVPFTFIKAGDTQMLSKGWSANVEAIGLSSHPIHPNWYDSPFLPERFRVDVVIDDFDGGRLTGWRNLLIGLLLTPIMGNKPQTVMSVRAGFRFGPLLSRSCEDQLIEMLDLPKRERAKAASKMLAAAERVEIDVGDEGGPDTMWHGSAFSRSLHLPPRQYFSMRADYTGDAQVPVGFLRVVCMGTMVRDIA